MTRHFLSSVTRIADFSEKNYDCRHLPRAEWANGDYVAGQVVGKSNMLYRVELCSGRIAPVLEGDILIGSLGRREATLEGVGNWESIGDDGKFHALTSAGLFGKLTSQSHLFPDLMRMNYKGHVFRNNKICMKDFVTYTKRCALSIPIIMIIGTSMSSGKTTSGRIIVHELKRMGYRVTAAKFTGAARYRDILSYEDAGADNIFDFVDVGLPSTVCREEEFKNAMVELIARISQTKSDILVAELGASPLEPYNGSTAMDFLEKSSPVVILSALDPYAVLGVQKAFGMKPDLITGPAANTDAGIALVEKLSGVKTLNLMRRRSLPLLREFLTNNLG